MRPSKFSASVGTAAETPEVRRKPSPNPQLMSVRVDFAKRVEKALVSSAGLSSEEAFETFENVRKKLLSELNEKERKDLSTIRKTEEAIAEIEKKLETWSREQAELAPGGDYDDLDDLDDFDCDILGSEKYEELEEKIETGYRKLESLRKKKEKLDLNAEWRAKAVHALSKASEKLLGKIEEIRLYEEHWNELLPSELKTLLSKNGYHTVRTAFSVTFLLKSAEGVPQNVLWKHYRDTPFSWCGPEQKKRAKTGVRETFLHESRHNAYEALYAESDFRQDVEQLHYRIRALEKIPGSRMPEALKKQRKSQLLREIRRKSDVFAEKFLSHNRDEILANFLPLSSFIGSTEVMNTNDIHAGLVNVHASLDEKSPAKPVAYELLRRFEKEVDGYYERLSNFLFVARCAKKLGTARALLYATEPHEFELAEAYVESLVGHDYYDAHSSLRKIMHPGWIPHSIPRTKKEVISQADLPNLLTYFKNAEAWDSGKRFKRAKNLEVAISYLEKKFLSKTDWKSLSAEEKLLRAIFGDKTDEKSEKAGELVRKIHEYLGNSKTK